MAPGAGAAYLSRMTGCAGYFRGALVHGKHWVAVSPNYEPHHQGFDRLELRAVDCEALTLVSDDVPMVPKLAHGDRG